ncbi:MAG TPA: IS110 family transposase [Gemmataceae bacterium]|nr:IS110 family transposase [Gemmataceae bacterium]
MSRHKRPPAQAKSSANEAPPRPASRPPRAQPVTLPVLNPNAAGIDVHSDMHMVCVPADRVSSAAAEAASGPANVRRFGANSCDLRAIADWLAECGVTTVAMESTGVYWIPLFELLESRGFEVWLVEPGQLSRCGARPKTDVLDAQWIQRLHSYGLLLPSFRPADSVMALRGYHRQRQMQIRYAASHTQHMQKALEQMNVKLTEVVSDITGLTGQRIIAAILDGERDPRRLAALRDPKCKNGAATIAKALEGTWRPEHLFALRQAYDLYQFHHRQIAQCDAAIQAELAKLPDRSGDKPFMAKPRRCGRKPNDLSFDACGPLFKALGVDLTEIEGIDVGTALVILAEIGVDVSRFPTEKHFASWLGVCPRQHESNQTKKKRRPRQGKNRVAITLRMAAQALGRTLSPLGLFYRRIKSRIGGKGAVTATAHKLAGLVYRMLKYGKDYVRRSTEEYEGKIREQLERSLQRRAAALGYELVPKPPSPPEPTACPLLT